MPRRSSSPKPTRQPAAVPPLPRPILLDRLADLMLSCGRTIQAERLAFEAAALREVTR
jgi:hypothetical protein